MRTRIFLANMLILASLAAATSTAFWGIRYLADSGGQASRRQQQDIFRKLSYPLAGNSLNYQAGQVVSQVTPAVVSIFGTKKTSKPAPAKKSFSPLLKLNLLFPQNVVTTQVVAGSGFFVSNDGYILTNKHVVSDTAASYTAQLADGSKLDAHVVYRDPAKDLAILKVAGQNYPTLNLGDSSGLKVGQEILSIGNAFGQFANTVSSGSISGLNKTIVADSDGKTQKLSNVIQTSAQLYPGDSGGPTFDLSGNVVGINVATAVTQYNVSFSIPINEAKSIIKNVVNPG